MLTPSSGNVGLQWSCNHSASAVVGENLTHLGAESQDHLVDEVAFSAQLQLLADFYQLHCTRRNTVD